MVGFGGGEHLLWRAVNIGCCRLGVVSRTQWERQLTVTVAVTAAVHLLSACHRKSVSSVFGDGSAVPQRSRAPLCTYNHKERRLWCYALRADLCNFVSCTLYAFPLYIQYIRVFRCIFVCICVCYWQGVRLYCRGASLPSLCDVVLTGTWGSRVPFPLGFSCRLK